MQATAQMGQYEIYEIIGQGGLATIFLARDTTQGPKSPLLALKCMKPEAAQQPAAVQGFAHEIRLLTSFDHPNLLRGQDAGKQRGIHYAVTDFIDGPNLRAINAKLQSPQLLLNLVPFLISEVLAGVAYLHDFTGENGKPLHLIHNDLTPANVLVSYEGEVKIADFGAATLGAPKQKPNTDQGVMGTLSYLAPEKLLGKKFDLRADLYAVGVMLYELAVGHPPFRHREGETDMDVLERITRGEFDPVDRAGNQLPDALKATIGQAMALKPKKRFASAKDMAKSLGIDLESETAAQARTRRQFLLGAAMKSLFAPEFKTSAHRR